MTDLAPYGWWLDYHPATALAFSQPEPLVAGGYYWEVTVTFTEQAAASVLMGIADSRTSLVDTCFAGLNLAVVQATGANFFNTGVAAGGGDTAGWGYPNRPGSGFSVATAISQVFGFCLQSVQKKLWYKNVTLNSPSGEWAGGTSIHGDPAANTFGADISATGPSPMVGNIYVLVGASKGASINGSGTVNFGATAFTGTPPTGFIAPAPGVGLNPADNSNIVLSNNNLSFSGSAVTATGLTNHNSVRSRFSIAQGP